MSVALFGQHSAQFIEVVEEQIGLDNCGRIDADLVHELIAPGHRDLLAHLEHTPLVKGLRQVAAGARLHFGLVFGGSAARRIRRWLLAHVAQYTLLLVQGGARF